MKSIDDAPRGLMELSQVNFGLIINGRIPITAYRPEWFYPPYDKGVEILLQPGMVKEDVGKVIDSSYMNDAHDSVHKWNGTAEEYNWPKMLSDASKAYILSGRLKKIAKKLENNEPVDILPLYGELGSAISQESFGLRSASEIDYKNYKFFKPSGYAPIDNTIGGIPSDGPIIVYGLTGVGKSTFTTGVINALLHKYPEDTAAIYTLEMNDIHWMARTIRLFPSIKEVLPRLLVSGSVKDIEELVAEITAKKVNYVVLDDMDNLVRSSDASEYERIYRRVKEVCRFMGIPVFVLCQPNRAAKFEVEQGNRFLGRFDVAWSGAAENSAALQIALQRTNGLDMKAETFPTTDSEMDYVIFWKSRDGWPGDNDPTKAVGPGACVMEHSANWDGKPYGKSLNGKPNWKLWPVASGGKKIGSKKREG